jgi:tetratricopeptide (TPR) repeat protein
MKSMDKIKGYKKALSCYNKALELEPSNLDILNNKALALAYLGDYENSYKILNQVVQDNPSQTWEAKLK